MTHYELNDCKNLSNIINILNSLTRRGGWPRVMIRSRQRDGFLCVHEKECLCLCAFVLTRILEKVSETKLDERNHAQILKISAKNH